MLTQARVKELFDYRDGNLFWNVSRGNKRAGSAAGKANIRGYIRIKIDGNKYYAHRLVWLWHNGYLPEHDVDHKNRNPLDNRIENLREVSRSCNLRNTGNFRHNTSGVKGVGWFTSGGKWYAEIKVGGVIIRIGYYASFIEAACHRLAAEQALGWEGCDSSSPAFQYVSAALIAWDGK